MTKTLWISMAVVAGMISGCATNKANGTREKSVVHAATPEQRAAAKDTSPISADKVTLFVNGLGCPQCASNIDLQLKRVRGIDKAYVDLGSGTVLLDLRPGGTHPSPARLASAVEDAGFTLVKIETR